MSERGRGEWRDGESKGERERVTGTKGERGRKRKSSRDQGRERDKEREGGREGVRGRGREKENLCFETFASCVQRFV